MLSHFVSFAFSFLVVKAAVPETHQLCRFVCPSSFGPAPLVDETLSTDGSVKDCIWFGNGFATHGASFDPVSYIILFAYALAIDFTAYCDRCFSKSGNVIPGSQFGSFIDTLKYADQHCVEIADGWTWPDGQVCLRDSVSSRTLQDDTIIPLPNNSPEACTSACDAMGFTFSGVEFGSECHCGTGIASSVLIQPISNLSSTSNCSHTYTYIY